MERRTATQAAQDEGTEMVGRSGVCLGICNSRVEYLLFYSKLFDS